MVLPLNQGLERMVGLERNLEKRGREPGEEVVVGETRGETKASMGRILYP